MISYTDEATVVTAPSDVNAVPLVYSVVDVAKILKIGRSSVYSLVKSGQLRCVRVGKTIRIPQRALMEYLNPSS